MATPNTLQSAMESAAATMSSTTPTETPASQGQAETQPAATTEGQGGEFIGIPADQPAAGQETQETPESSGKIELAVSPDTVLGQIDGKPLTAQEVQNGYLRQADYTRKTQETAALKAEVEPYVPFIRENLTYLEDFASGDTTRITSALLDIAKNFNVDLGSAAGGGRARGADGRFVAATTPQEASALFDLSEFEEGSDAWEVAKRSNDAYTAQAAKVAEIEERLNSFTSGIEQRVSEHTRLTEAAAIGDRWKASGFEGIDTDGAMALVGEPMTVEQAMTIHHFAQILRHNVAVAQKRASATPHEPSGVQREPGSLAGKSLSQAFDERLR